MVTAYDIVLEEKVEKILLKMKKKDMQTYLRVIKSILKVAKNPEIGKPLKNVLKGYRRIHVGHFVLIYRVERKEKKIIVLKFSHHDDAYK